MNGMMDEYMSEYDHKKTYLIVNKNIFICLHVILYSVMININKSTKKLTTALCHNRNHTGTKFHRLINCTLIYYNQLMTTYTYNSYLTSRFHLITQSPLCSKILLV